LSELASARAGWLHHQRQDDGRLVWLLQVSGRRSEGREVPLTSRVVDLIRRDFERRGLGTDLLAVSPTTPLLAHLAEDRPLSVSRLHEIVKAAFERCADHLETSDARSAQKIRSASTHWLRHTFGTQALARGVPQDVVQATLGHKSATVTSIYARSEPLRAHHTIRDAFER
jgi:site-specific recombinase XerD